jgi:hypothetical protein
MTPGNRNLSPLTAPLAPQGPPSPVFNTQWAEYLGDPSSHASPGW